MKAIDTLTKELENLKVARNIIEVEIEEKNDELLELNEQILNLECSLRILEGSEKLEEAIAGVAPAETRSSNYENKIDFFGEKTPERSIPYYGEVFCYDVKGTFLESFKNLFEASEKLKDEMNLKKPESSKHYIGYCCNGTYQPNIENANHHKYKNRLFFSKKLSLQDIDYYRAKGVIK